MANTLSIGADKDPVGLCQYRSDGDTIPFVATTTHALGDIVVRLTADNKIGVVAGLASPDDSAATVGDEVALRVTGMIWAPKSASAMADGARLIWSNGAQQFEAHADGPHEHVGGADAGDSYALVRINVGGGGASTSSPSASPSASPSSSSS
jgi:predicted RecA/RadA family phage recombinase